MINRIRTGPLGDTPIALLHSAGLDLTYWDAQIADLRPDHDVVALDLPGHGLSTVGPDPFTIADLAVDAAAAIAELGRPVDLVGLSVGGLIAQVIAADYPHLVGSLVLIDTAAHFAAPGQRAMRERARSARTGGVSSILKGLFEHWFLPETLARRPELVDRATKTLLADDPGVQARLWEAIADFDGLDRLADIHVPTMVLVGEHDQSSPVTAARELAAGIDDARVQVIPDAAHLAPIEAPDIVTTHLRRFVDSQPVRAGRR